jgi:pimeloyl-ACP methyl ester carboxylesterase
MAVLRPAAISVCVLNDIGPVIETGGLARIIGYVGRTPVPATWDDAARIVRGMNEQFFTDLPDEEWDIFARQIFADADGRPQSDYDAKLAKSMDEIDLTEKIPTMWPQFGALAQMPTLVLRGENSDLLSEQTVREMESRHSGLATYTVPEQGHAPLLHDQPTLERIASFLADNDAP